MSPSRCVSNDDRRKIISHETYLCREINKKQRDAPVSDRYGTFSAYVINRTSCKFNCMCEQSDEETFPEDISRCILQSYRSDARHVRSNEAKHSIHVSFLCPQKCILPRIKISAVIFPYYYFYKMYNIICRYQVILKYYSRCYTYEQECKKQRGARIKIRLESSPEIVFLRKYQFPRHVTVRTVIIQDSAQHHWIIERNWETRWKRNKEQQRGWVLARAR